MIYSLPPSQKAFLHLLNSQFECQEMEGGDQNLGNGLGGSRWTPTKEQISMLEELYRQGLRTPTAEQIQQITDRLKCFGHVEGKNVFYWFQNHKARQRQKQKQENFACFNRFHRPSPPLFLPPHPNAVFCPCYITPNNDNLGFYRWFPKVPLAAAGGCKRINRPIPESIDELRSMQPTCPRYKKSMHDPRSNDNNEYSHFMSCTEDKSSHYQETLDLFPIHPTGILETRSGSMDNGDKNSISANTPSPSEDFYEAGNCGTHHVDYTFFDFFSRN